MGTVRGKLKITVLLFILFFAVAAYAAVVKDAVQTASDLTLPLLFNGLVPVGFITWVGKRYLDKQDRLNDELVKCKNDHETRISEMETIHSVRGCDQPGDASRNRRRGD